MTFQLLKCIARAVAKNGGKFLCDVIPGANALLEIAADAFADYCQCSQEDALRAEVQALAQAPVEQLRQEIRTAVQAGASQLPADVQRKMTTYLTQVPAMIRRSLRRPSDPTGATVPPSLSLNRSDDLLPFLPARPPRFQPGDRPLAGVDWVLVEPLGVGGFGEVWKARHAHLHSKLPVALKFCLDASAVPVLRNEAGVLDRVMQRGRHPGIVPLLQTYLGADPPCLEYEYVEGGDLAALILELHGRGKSVTATANRVLLRLAEIVAFAHQANPPIVHGDLKPANVLVGRGAKGELALRVTDFGIGGLAAHRAALEARQPTLTRQTLLSEAVRGAYTPLYASAQQMARRPGEPADPRDDVHALGVIWYQLVTGDLGMMSVPTDWREQLEQRGQPEALLKLLAVCIAPQADRRPASAVVLAAQLKAALGVGEKPQGAGSGEVIPTVIPMAVPVAVVPPRPAAVPPPPRPAAAPPPQAPRIIPVGTQERAAEVVFWPAIWLLHVGGLLCLAVPILFLVMIATGELRHAEVAILFLLGEAVGLALGIVILRAGIHFLKLRSYRMALIGSIAMIYLGVLTLPLFGAGLLILPGGIWATRVLRRKEVKSAFATRGKERDLSPAEAEKRQQAEEALFGPALWLLHVGGLLCVAGPVLLLGLMASGGLRYAELALLALLGGPLVFALGVVILRAGIHLLKLQSYKVALFGSVVMIYLGVLTLPALGAGLLILPGGIWATRVVRRSEVKAAFER